MTRQLPYNVPFACKVSLIEQFHADWKVYCDKCFTAVQEVTQKALRELIMSHFGHYTTPLPGKVGSVVDELIEKRRELTVQRIEWLLALENPPFTQNNRFFVSYREKYLALYKDARKVHFLVPFLDSSLIILASASADERQPGKDTLCLDCACRCWLQCQGG